MGDHAPSSVHFVPLPNDDRIEAAPSHTPPRSSARRSTPSPHLPASPFPPSSSSFSSSSSSASPSAGPTVWSTYCSTRRRVFRSTVVVVGVVALCVVGAVMNLLVRPERDPAVALCSSWVTEYHITPDAVDNCPSALMTLTYGGLDVPYASTLATNYTRLPPAIRLSSPQRSHAYSVFIVDPDFPSATNTSYRSRLHLLVLNVPAPPSASEALELSAGLTLFGYVPLCPPVTTGPHRYVVVVYDTPPLTQLPNATVPPVRFNVQDTLGAIWRQDLNGNVVGGTFFYSTFDDPDC